LMISDGNWLIFFDKPIALSLILVAVFLIIITARSVLNKN
jgi:TctA family transporter